MTIFLFDTNATSVNKNRGRSFQNQKQVEIYAGNIKTAQKRNMEEWRMRKVKTVYQCETCGSIFKTAEECEAHEKLHIKPLGICSYLGCRIPYKAPGVKDELYPHEIHVRLSNGKMGCYTLARVVENSEGGEKYGKG